MELLIEYTDGMYVGDFFLKDLFNSKVCVCVCVVYKIHRFHIDDDG